MKKWKKPLLFAIGGGSYVVLEMLWRGRSHYSMFFAGGSCFILLGALQKKRPKMSLPLKALLGAGIITGVEFLFGLLANGDYSVWDYRNMPLNVRGHICLPFTLLWAPISLVAMQLYRQLDARLLPGLDS